MSFEQDKTIMTLYIDSAKTYVQLSTGVLALTITFLEELRGAPLPLENPRWLLGSWVAFLIAIGAGALYQYVAIKYLDAHSDDPGAKGLLPQRLVEEPGIVYGVMVAAFYVGALSLVGAAWHAMQ